MSFAAGAAFGQTISFTAATNFPTEGESFSVAVGDFNRDGKQDLAVANTNDDNVGILLGVGDGTFGAPVTFAVGDAPEGVVVGDFNGDGIQDLAVTNFTTWRSRTGTVTISRFCWESATALSAPPRVLQWGMRRLNWPSGT
jgi:hypothetical protein